MNKRDEIKAEVIKDNTSELLFLFPTNEIVINIQKINVSNPETYSNIIDIMCEVKGDEAVVEAAAQYMLDLVNFTGNQRSLFLLKAIIHKA